MLAPSGGGLILYQAYGNLYAMTGRKAHLLEDKQIPSVGVFDEVDGRRRHKIHVDASPIYPTTSSQMIGERAFINPRVRSEKIYNHAKDVDVTASRVIGDAIIKREEALTAYGTETGQNSVPIPETALTVCTTRLRGQLHTILEDMDRYPNACLEELEAFMTLWDVKPRVEESSLETLSVDELITQLRQMCEDAEDRASNAQEEARQKRKEALEEVVTTNYS
ncbi:hypothetical protein Tco_0195339 [Tanacetum coccineum]